jgi:hypothetical protein
MTKGKTKAEMAWDSETLRELTEGDIKALTSVWRWPKRPASKLSELEAFMSLQAKDVKEEIKNDDLSKGCA